MNYTAFVALLLVSSALAMPTSQDDNDQLSITESLQNPEKTKKPAVGQEPSTDKFVEPLDLPSSTPAVRDDKSAEAKHPDSETPSPDVAAAEDSELAEDILDGKKAVVVVGIFKLPNNDYNGAAVRKQRCVNDATSDPKQESTASTAVTETTNKFSEKTESSSQNSEEKNESSRGQREVRSSDSDSQDVRDEGDEEDGMSVAETIIFRPLFSYRQDTAARRRYFRAVSGINTDFDYY